VSVALFDLGQRLRAAALARPVARSTFAPVLRPIEPVAATAAGSGDRIVVQTADALRTSVASGPDALSAIADLGVSIGPALRTLVVPDRETLGHLLELARATELASPYASTAAVVGWWAHRADHPGTNAVLDVVSACAARWVLGVPPVHEGDIAVWCQSLAVADRGPRGLLEFAAAVSAGTTLPGLEATAEDDRASWDAFVARTTDPKFRWDWRRRDSRREAALGLASRCDAAELYESLRLGDPLAATRESFGGAVVSGLIAALPSRSVVEVKLDQLSCRLREQTAVDGFAGYPRDLPPALASAPLLRGRVAATRVTIDERLVITIGDAILRSARVGQRVTLRPRSIDPRQQRSGRQELHRRYAARRSWLSGGSPPAPRRRDIPLDVVIAAAE
jgi:hypothetical protein